MGSTWPVNSGVLVHDGVCYFAAGIIDSDGTYVYALDAKTGELRWQNNSSGHLNEKLRKGVSVQGNLTLDGDRLLLAGGNQVSPAAFDVNTGKCLTDKIDKGQPIANNGRFVGLFAGQYPIVGGRILYAAAENVSTKGSFEVDAPSHGRLTLNFGGIPPAWDDETVALVNFQNGALTCLDAEKVAHRLTEGVPRELPNVPNPRRMGLFDLFQADGAVTWSSDLGESNKFEAVSIVMGPHAIVAAIQQQHRGRAKPQWFVVAFDKVKGEPLWRHEVAHTPLPDGLLVDREGRVVVTLVNGDVLCLAPQAGGTP
jgi:outer membrane protein assembly factor BamB